jgi:hypothetical protein
LMFAQSHVGRLGRGRSSKPGWPISRSVSPQRGSSRARDSRRRTHARAPATWAARCPMVPASVSMRHTTRLSMHRALPCPRLGRMRGR